MSTRRPRFGRFGLAEDPRGRTIAEPLLTVVGVYRCETRSQTILQTRHFDGSLGPDLAAGAVLILDDDVGTLQKEGFFDE